MSARECVTAAIPAYAEREAVSEEGGGAVLKLKEFRLDSSM